MATIQIDNLSFTYPSRETPTLRNITATVALGDFILLTGATGSGKSTLLRTINGLIPHASAGTFTGTVYVDAKNVAEQPLAETCQLVNLLFQEPDYQLFCTHIEDEIAFGLENIGTPPQEMTARIDVALEQVGLSGFRNRRTSELSGGEKQLVALACLCAMRPKVLLLDEPTSYLSRIASKNILNIVKKLNVELRVTVLLATHRTAEVAPLCNRVWLLNNSELYSELCIEEAYRAPELYERLGVQPLGAKEVRGRFSLFSGPTGEIKEASALRTSKSPLLQTENISFTYPDARNSALNGISYEVNRGEAIAIMGENGSGKTTLLHLMAGLLRPAAGKILLDSETLMPNRLRRLATKVGIVFQNPELLLQAETVFDELAFGPRNLKLPLKTVHRRVANMLFLFNLDTLASEAPHALSRGQRQRVAVAAICALQPELLLLDEPTTGQDVQQTERLMRQLCQLCQREGKTLIFTTHEPELTLKYANRLLFLQDGELIFDGAPMLHNLP